MADSQHIELTDTIQNTTNTEVLKLDGKWGYFELININGRVYKKWRQLKNK